MPSAESEEFEIRLWAGSNCLASKNTSSPAAKSANVDAIATTRREADSDASSGTITSQMAANEEMPPVATATIITRPISANEERI